MGGYFCAYLNNLEHRLNHACSGETIDLPVSPSLCVCLYVCVSAKIIAATSLAGKEKYI